MESKPPTAVSTASDRAYRLPTPLYTTSILNKISSAAHLSSGFILLFCLSLCLSLSLSLLRGVRTGLVITMTRCTYLGYCYLVLNLLILPALPLPPLASCIPFQHLIITIEYRFASSSPNRRSGRESRVGWPVNNKRPIHTHTHISRVFFDLVCRRKLDSWPSPFMFAL